MCNIQFWIDAFYYTAQHRRGHYAKSNQGDRSKGQLERGNDSFTSLLTTQTPRAIYKKQTSQAGLEPSPGAPNALDVKRHAKSNLQKKTSASCQVLRFRGWVLRRSRRWRALLAFGKQVKHRANLFLRQLERRHDACRVTQSPLKSLRTVAILASHASWTLLQASSRRRATRTSGIHGNLLLLTPLTCGFALADTRGLRCEFGAQVEFILSATAVVPDLGAKGGVTSSTQSFKVI